MQHTALLYVMGKSPVTWFCHQKPVRHVIRRVAELTASFRCIQPAARVQRCGDTTHELPGGAETPHWPWHLGERLGHSGSKLQNLLSDFSTSDMFPTTLVSYRNLHCPVCIHSLLIHVGKKKQVFCKDHCLASQSSGWVTKHVEKFNVLIFSDTINVMNVKLCMMVLLTELNLFISPSVTLTIFQDHSGVEQCVFLCD